MLVGLYNDTVLEAGETWNTPGTYSMARLGGWWCMAEVAMLLPSWDDSIAHELGDAFLKITSRRLERCIEPDSLRRTRQGQISWADQSKIACT